MSAPVKTIGGAYGMAILGLLLGIVGMQRFYARRYLSALLMTLLFLGGLILLTWELIAGYYALLDQVTAGLSALDGGQVGAIPDVSQLGKISPQKLQLGYLLCGAGGLWWTLDLFLIPSMVNRYLRENNLK